MSLLENRNIRLVDWSGNVDFGRGEVVVPRSEEDVVSLVRLCRDSGKKLRVIGLRTSWNALWYCKDVMMVSDELDAIREIDPENRTITCEPGVTLTTLHQRLWEQGLSLDSAPGIDWVTVGGAISTGSHGSGHRSISSSLVACRLVTADGEVLEIGEGDDRLDAVRISQGMLGVLTSVTLRAVPRYHVHVKRTRIPTQDWRRFLTEGEMSYALCFPYTETTVMVRVDVIPDAEEAARIVASLRGEDAANARQSEVAPGPSEESPFSPAETMKAVCALANLDPSTFPARNRYLLDVYFPDAEHAGPAHELLMSYRSEPIAGAEWAVPVAG